MEDDLKILKVEYISNRLLDHTQILNLSFDDQNMFSKSSKWWRPQMEDNLKILKVEYLRNHCMDLWVLRGKLEENSEEILSLALLSPACLTFCSICNQYVTNCNVKSAKYSNSEPTVMYILPNIEVV